MFEACEHQIHTPCNACRSKPQPQTNKGAAVWDMMGLERGFMTIFSVDNQKGSQVDHRGQTPEGGEYL